MRKSLSLSVAVLLLGAANPVLAQNIPRIKATVVSLSGATLIVQPQGDKDTMRVTVRPATRILKEEPREFSDIHAGDFVGATLMKNTLGVLTAQEIHIFPESLKGSGEGLYPAPGGQRMILNGTVGQAGKTTLGVRFRGASGEGPVSAPNSRNQAGCTGRAPDDPLGGCQGSVIIAVPANAVVLALADGNKDDVKPGAVLALSLMSGPDGKPATPGFTIESVATPPVPVPDMPLTPKARPAPASAGGKKSPR
jgi:hypothetical protein